MGKEDHKEELMELGHEAVPGYTPVFWVVFVIAWLYLGFLFVKHLF